VLTDLANKISADAIAAGQADPVYVPYLYLANDGTAINTGFLVKSTRVNTVKVEQMGLTTTFTNSTGSQAVLNDRTPLVLHAGIKRAGSTDYPVTVISVHQRSLINVDDPTSTGKTVRLKREAQAEYLANLIQGYQAGGEHVIAVGDYNAFEFSDGFVDTLGVTLGKPVPAAQVITPPVAGLANPPLVDLVTLLPAAQRQSYVETGSAQVLDHVVVTSDLVPTETRLVYAHMDSDFPLVYLNDATRPERVSDHDPAVAYFAIPAPKLTATLTPATGNFGNSIIGVSSTGQVFTLTNTGEGAITITSIAATGDYSVSNNCGATLAPGATCAANAVFKATAAGTRTGSLTVVTNAGTLTSALTGTGLGAPDFTVGDSTGSSSTSLTNYAGNATPLNLTFTPLNGISTTVTITCAPSSGTQIAGVTCTPPAAFTLSGTAAVTQLVTFTTTSRLKASGIALPGSSRSPWMATTY
jgi:hypothetical protein